MDKRTLIAVILSLIVLIGWSYFFPEKPVPPKKAPPEEVPQPLKPVPSVQAEREQTVPEIPLESPVTGDSKAHDIIVETDLYRAVFSSQGAIVKSWELKNYKSKEEMPVILLDKPGVIPPLGILFEGPNRTMPLNLIYGASIKKLVLSQNNPTGELIFSYSKQGMSIRKRFVFHNDDFRADFSVETVNTPSYMLPVGTDFGVFDKEQREHKGPVMLANDDRKEFDDSLKSLTYITGNISWIAQEDKYFAAALIPLSPVKGATIWKEAGSAEIALNLEPQKHDFILYAGPKEYDRLKQLNAGFQHIVDFGWFAFVAMPLFVVLKFFYKILGNYGWAIILLTIVVRIPFIPILHKSQKSMKKMQKVQPLMAEIKEKYKKDSAKMQKEMMAIYKKHKVNPVGGCLPMLLQIPVFIALYNVLLKAIELRGAPFVFWITDLSAKDPYYVLPIVMGLTMVLQQKMTPTAMDPKQAKIMMFMPIVFTIMFLQFASGLVLYWLVNNVLGIAQQYYANKKAS